jgi:cytochrome b561
LVIAIVLSVGGAFLYLGGWLSPARLTPGRLVNTFERLNGPHPGFRRNLLAIHRPLGMLILMLAVVRVLNRQVQPLPPFLATMSARERLIATASERLLYALMFLLPLVGWGMLSAARIPVRIGPLVLPAILPHDLALYTLLRRSHTALAYLLFFTFMAHLSAVLFHTLVLRDGLLSRMLPWAPRSRTADRAHSETRDHSP